jgi:twitching motility protein PilI
MVINQEYFTVELGSQITLGLPLGEMGIVTQFDFQNICPVPGVANYWYGVVNFKGSLLWILDSDRFFNLNLQHHQLAHKITTVVVKNPQLDSDKQVAIVCQKLNGIVNVDPACCKPLADHAPPQLSQCCSSIVQIEDQSIYLLNATALLQKLHQQSMLVSA